MRQELEHGNMEKSNILKQQNSCEDVIKTILYAKHTHCECSSAAFLRNLLISFYEDQLLALTCVTLLGFQMLSIIVNLFHHISMP
jgi:hypothetical protein